MQQKLNSRTKFNLGSAIAFVCFMLLAALNLNSQSQSSCGTPGWGSGYIGPILQSFNPSPTGPFFLKLYPHVIRKPDGSGGQPDDAVDAAFARLAADFGPHNIFFVRACEVINIPVTTAQYNDFDIYCDLWETYQHNDGIDMFFGPEEGLNNGGGIASGVPGKSFWVAGVWPYGPGAPHNTITSPILSHEMAHCLGLFHTHHGTVHEGGNDCQGNN